MAASGGVRPSSPTDLPKDEVEVLALFARGYTIERIARALGVSERTVRRRLRAAADALGAGTSVEAVVRAVRTGLI
ncbi:helix-turn-helix domain-containing protein [Nocardioides sp. NPDC057772]|uniref:helix-turn-helix domain-containing protein n=1 Tax=Nocardioides sp. NPDC057772 TaxID=3346245 RepID=UPI00366D006D